MNPLSIIEKYYEKGTQLYSILVTHSEQVRDKAIDIIKKNPHLNASLEFVSEAALLHDIGIFMTDAPKIYCEGAHPYIMHGYLGAELLRKEGLPRHALVCERHTGTGLTREQIIANRWPLPHEDFLPQSIEEQIICFADKFYSKTHLESELSIKKIRATMACFGAESLARFDAWEHMFIHC